MKLLENTPYKLDFLLALRGILALTVILHHYRYGPYLDDYFGTGLFKYLAPHGHYSVYGFFVLSGYLMAKVLMLKYDYPGGIRHFYFNRFTRIVPLYYFSIIITVLATISSPKGSKMNIQDFLINNLAFISNYKDFKQSIENVALWSISTEVQFYLIAPLFAFFLASRTPLKLVSFTLSVIGFSFVARLIYFNISPPGFQFYTNLEVNLVFFGAGWASYLYKESIPRVSSWGAFSAFMGVLMICWVVDVNMVQIGFVASLHTNLCFFIIPALFSFSAFLLMPSLDMTIGGNKNDNIVTKVLRPVFYFLGITSFSAYVLHLPLPRLIHAYWPGAFNYPGAFLVNLYGLCFLIYLVWEKPFFALRVHVKTPRKNLPGF